MLKSIKLINPKRLKRKKTQPLFFFLVSNKFLAEIAGFQPESAIIMLWSRYLTDCETWALRYKAHDSERHLRYR
ncbi:hypothetical protein Hanom_Chr05g00476061 [Helianthus anomalus]